MCVFCCSLGHTFRKWCIFSTKTTNRFVSSNELNIDPVSRCSATEKAIKSMMVWSLRVFVHFNIILCSNISTQSSNYLPSWQCHAMYFVHIFQCIILRQLHMPMSADFYIFVFHFLVVLLLLLETVYQPLSPLNIIELVRVCSPVMLLYVFAFLSLPLYLSCQPHCNCTLWLHSRRANTSFFVSQCVENEIRFFCSFFSFSFKRKTKKKTRNRIVSKSLQRTNYRQEH